MHGPSPLEQPERWGALTLAGGLLFACGAPPAGPPDGPGAAASSHREAIATTPAAPGSAAAPPGATTTTAPTASAGPSALASTGSPGAATSVAKETLRLERTIPAGKWPEGLAIVDGVAWIAESGSRRLIRVALESDAPPSHVAVGRLPVEIALGPNRKLYTVAHTDKTVWEIDPATSKARTFATVPDCPESMVIADGAAWVLQWSKCSSAGSSVVRVDLATRKQSVSPETGSGAWDLGVAAGRAWVSLSDGTLRSVDGATLRDVRQVGTPVGGGPRTVMAAGAAGVLSTHGKVLTRTDPASATRTHQVTLTEPIAALSLDAETLVAIGHQGTIWELDAATLATRRELASPARDAMPRAIARHGDRYVVTDHGDGDHGRLLVLSVAPSAR